MPTSYTARKLPEGSPGEGESGLGERAGLAALHVVAPAETGGLEAVVQMLATGHRCAGHRVGVAVILSGDGAGHPFLPPLREAGVELFPLRLPGRAYLREGRALAELFRRFRPSVVHTHGYRPDVIAGRVARRAGIPTVSTVHGFTGGGWKNRLYEEIQRRALRRHDAVVAVSRPLAERLERDGVARDRIHLLPNAWAGGRPLLDRSAARRALGIPEDRVVIGWVGRLTQEKGADVLVDALSRLTDLPVEVSFVGDGRERRALESRARQSGVAERVRWHGVVREAGRLLPAFDLFVLSSRTEGTPIALFEAMAAETPIVASRVGGVPDAVSPAEAVLVDPEDPGALAEAVRRTLSDPAGARARARAARLRLGVEHGAEQWLARYRDLYLGILQHSAPVSVP